MSITVRTSLATKLYTPLLGIFGLVMVVLLTYVPSIVLENAVNSATSSAVSTVNQYKILRGYYTKNVVKKVLAGSELKAHFDHKTNANAIPLPATLIHDLSEAFNDQGIMTLKLYSPFPFPNRRSRRLDDFGQQAWEILSRNPDQTYSRVETIDGHETVRVAVADTLNAQGCVSCHNSHPDTPKNDWSLNDVRGVLEVQIPIDAQIAAGSVLKFKIIALMIIALLVIVATLGLLFRRLIFKRLQAVSEALNEIAGGDGDLSQRLPSPANDEIGAITHAFNHFVEQLEYSLKQIGLQAHQLVETVGVLKAVVERSQQGASRQHQETDQVATAMNEMTATAQEVATLAANTADSTQSAEEKAESGRRIIDENRCSVERLSEKMAQVTEVVNHLESDSQNIGGVLDVIRGIAEQTNLLALNAAIEAARAGEQGRGFAVVADEVRTLASRTQASTEEIQVMIGQLQKGAQSAVTAIEEGNNSLKSSLENANQTHEVITTIAEAISSIRNMNLQIATAAEEQTSVSDEMNRNITTIADVAYESNEGAQKLLTSTGEITEALTAINIQLQRFTGGS